MTSRVLWSCRCFSADERMTRSLRDVSTTMTGEPGNSFAYPLTYFNTCRGWAPVHEKRSMREGEFGKGAVGQLSKDLGDILRSIEKECLISSSKEYMELPRDSTLVSESSFSISYCRVRFIEGSRRRLGLEYWGYLGH